jgi:class 3 adenylate cyclase/tetratricopeptide (TPR) repeat protein
MNCPKCRFENRDGAKFCLKCGEKLELTCPQCGKALPLLAAFCDECGQRLRAPSKAEKPALETEGERKQVSVLFSDLSGYTAMSEKLDPEEVKDITNRIFSEISKIIGKYEGFVEKFIGDAVMALFGIPQSHEDDPVRAIRTAREIHDLVDALGPEIVERIGQPLSMHSGINTGLVVTGEVDKEKGTHGAAGDTINMASRLSSLAKAGEILVGADTYRRAEGHFIFEGLEPVIVKGKTEPVHAYRVLAPKDIPVTTHRVSGRRAELVGRKVELSLFQEAIENLRKGKGRIFSISGDTGTGKSRLVAEFKAGLNHEEIRWIEGHAYAYAQNIPYFPLIDMLNRMFHIEEGEASERVKDKIESGIEDLLGKKEDVIPYVGSLYALSYPEVQDVSPEFWKGRLQEAILMILTALAQQKQTIFCLEDLHWADPSFIELLRHAMLQIRQPAIVLCVYRPTFSLFTSHQLTGIAKIYEEIRLQDLSSSEANDMLESLLDTEAIPPDLSRYVQHKAEGNPFYLEELVNSLIESGILVPDDGHWKVTGPIGEADVSSTIHGIISGRLDRLEKETKRILQEASVIGRAFLYEVLRRITELKEDIDRSLRGLEQLDLIRTRSLQPELEYTFKHALIQDVVYNGILKKDRQEIHERIARVIESLFQDRLPEFYETLAFHFKQSRSVHEAAHYLINSGEKSLKRYAVQESHLHFKEAFDLLNNKPDRTREEDKLLIDLLMKWALVFYYRGDFKGLTPLLDDHEDLAESLEDKEQRGLFHAWQGWALFNRHRYQESYEYLRSALELGETIQSQKLIGYACCWLAWTCTNRGLFDEALQQGERALKIAQTLPSDQYLYFKSLGGIGWANVHRGAKKKAMKAGRALLDYGKKSSNIRSMVLGHYIIGFAHFHDDELMSAIEACKNAAKLAADPYYYQFSNLLLGAAYLQNGQIQEAEQSIREVLSFTTEYGCENVGIPAKANSGLLMMAKGQMGRGLMEIEGAFQTMIEKGGRYLLPMYRLSLGQVFLQIADKTAPVSLSVMAKNIRFILKNVPSAAKKAEEHLRKTIEITQEIGSKGVLGRTYLNLGLLQKNRGRTDEAKESISKAIQVFEEGEFENCLQSAKKTLASLITG